MSLKILILSNAFSPDIGGIETHSEIIAEYFHKAGHTVRLITWTKKLSPIFFPYKIIRNPSIWILIKEHVWADVILENNVCLKLAWPRLFLNRISVISLQTWISRANGRVGIRDLIKYKWLKQTNVVIACSDFLRKKCWPGSTVINNSYNDEQFVKLDNVEKTIAFVFLGRLVSDKGADLAIHALHKITSLEKNQETSSMNISLTIIGDGPERSKLENLVKSLNLENQVHFKGALSGEELVNCLNQHRYIIVPSRWEEPFGIVVLEGMACGCLPIVSDSGGLPDAVGSAGFTFKRGDVDDLVNSIQKILNDPLLERQLREAAVTHLAAHRPSLISHRYLELIEKAALRN